MTKARVKKLLNEILDHQIANRGNENWAFYTCYTYGRGRMPPWVSKAEQLIRDLDRTSSTRSIE